MVPVPHRSFPWSYFSRIVVEHINITERKLVEETLRSSEVRFRALVTATSDVVYRMSADWE